jgi:hypothetical protein
LITVPTMGDGLAQFVWKNWTDKMRDGDTFCGSASLPTMFLWPVLVVVLLVCCWCTSTRGAPARWYYTGRFENDKEHKDFFAGQLLNLSSLFDNHVHPENSSLSSHILYCGGLALHPEAPANGSVVETLDEENMKFLGHITVSSHSDDKQHTDNDTPHPHSPQNHPFSVPTARKYAIHIVRNYAHHQQQQQQQQQEAGTTLDSDAPSESAARCSDDSERCLAKLSTSSSSSTSQVRRYPVLHAEVGLYDAQQGIFLEKEWNVLTIGNLFAVVVVDNKGQLRHQIVFTTDLYGRRSLISHTWSSLSSTAAASAAASSPVVDESSSDQTANRVESIQLENGEALSKGMSTNPLRVVTYNLWHNNPPSWIYGNKK